MRSHNYTEISRRTLWASRILMAIPALFMLFDGFMKMTTIAPVTESFIRLGYPLSVAKWIGIVQLLCVVVYLIPRTTMLGAILLTGYLGGAVATHVRVGDPLLTHTLFPVFVAMFLWGGLYLRDTALRTLVPLRS